MRYYEINETAAKQARSMWSMSDYIYGNIRRIKTRITEIENLKNVTEISADNLKNDYNTELFKVIENTEIMRLQLIFDDKPSAEIREILKKNGFKWSPSNSAWQRQLTDNAKRSLKRVIEELHM